MEDEMTSLNYQSKVACILQRAWIKAIYKKIKYAGLMLSCASYLDGYAWAVEKYNYATVFSIIMINIWQDKLLGMRISRWIPRVWQEIKENLVPKRLIRKSLWWLMIWKIKCVIKKMSLERLKSSVSVATWKFLFPLRYHQDL